MNLDRLYDLTQAVKLLLGEESVRDSISRLKKEIFDTPEAFVWSVVNCESLSGLLPSDIKSGWIFVLKRNTPTGAHYHPNSVQHMVVIEGKGRSKIGGEERDMVQFSSPGQKLDELWYVIDRNVPHEFFPEDTDMVVMSFHTCVADKLQEVSCETGELRFYEDDANAATPTAG